MKSIRVIALQYLWKAQSRLTFTEVADVRFFFFFNLQKLKYPKSEEPNDDSLLPDLLVPPYNEDFPIAVSKFCSQEKISHRLFCHYKRVLFCDFQGS